MRIREEIAKHVEPCRETFLRVKGYWCWYDPHDYTFKYGGSPQASSEAALENAISLAKEGRVFVEELEQIDRELKQ